MRTRGQIVIPEALRKALDLKEGDLMDVDIKKLETKSRVVQVYHTTDNERH
jgi:AbrB family looped-hinge helix DNA binding protein